MMLGTGNSIAALPLGALLLLVPGCFRGERESDVCRVGAAFQRDPLTQQVTLSRCEQIETREVIQDALRQERRDARERELREQRAELVRQARLRQEEERRVMLEREAAFAEIRRNPKAPELGATLPEVAQLCRQQSGKLERGSESQGAFSCYVGGVEAFATTAKDGRVIATDVFYEGREVETLRRIGERRYGPGEERIVGGFRTWYWPDLGVVIGSYRHGATLSLRAPETRLPLQTF